MSFFYACQHYFSSVGLTSTFYMLLIIIGDLLIYLSWLYTAIYRKEHLYGATWRTSTEKVIMQFYWQVY